MLVPAVLRPEEGEDGQFEVVGLAAEQTPDTVEFPVGQAERAVKRLFRDRAQGGPHLIAWLGSTTGSVRSVVRGYVPLAPHRRRDLGGVVPLHQGRGARDRADRDDGPSARLRRRSCSCRFSSCALGPRGAVAELRSTGAGAFILGVTNMAFPFVLIAWGEKHIDSGVAAIANATVPIFVALLAIRFNPSERVRGWRLVGVALGLVGVGVLAGLHPQGGWWGVAGTLAVVVASLSYASANLYAQHRFPRRRPSSSRRPRARGRARAPPFRAAPAARRDAELEGDRLRGRTRDRRDGVRAALLLRHAQPLRGLAVPRSSHTCCRRSRFSTASSSSTSA